LVNKSYKIHAGSEHHALSVLNCPFHVPLYVKDPSAKFTVALVGIFIFIPRILKTLLGTLGNCSALNLSATCAVSGYAFCSKIMLVAV